MDGKVRGISGCCHIQTLKPLYSIIYIYYACTVRFVIYMSQYGRCALALCPMFASFGSLVMNRIISNCGLSGRAHGIQITFDNGNQTGHHFKLDDWTTGWRNYRRVESITSCHIASACDLCVCSVEITFHHQPSPSSIQPGMNNMIFIEKLFGIAHSI